MTVPALPPNEKNQTPTTPVDSSQLLQVLQTYYQRHGLQWIISASIIGGTSGILLAGFHRFIHILWEGKGGTLSGIQGSGNLWAYLLLPAVGLCIARFVFKAGIAKCSHETTEDFIKAYHNPDHKLRLSDLPGRLIASAATIGLGGSLGLEGPGIATGATVGTAVQNFSRKWFNPDNANILMVAGVAAGIAAVFKAPLTGVVFALEVPYQRDLARQALVPSLIAASTSYLSFTAIEGTTRIFQDFEWPAQEEYQDLYLAILLGVFCAFAARLFIFIFQIVGDLARKIPSWALPPTFGLLVGTLGVLSYVLTDSYPDLILAFPAALGMGTSYPVIVVLSHASWWILLSLALMRMFASALTAKAGGVGGVFFSLVFIGAITGRLFAEMPFISESNLRVYAIVGIAATVGAGYRSPLSAVAFVAETTGQPGFLIPALLASATAYMLMGDHSISGEQLTHYWSSVEQRLSHPIRELLHEHPHPLYAGTPLHTLTEKDLLAHKSLHIPVVNEEGCLVGIFSLASMGSLPKEEWKTKNIGDTMKKDILILHEKVTIGDAAQLLSQEDTDHAAVVDGKNFPIGILTVADILKLKEVLTAVALHHPATLSSP